MHHAFSLIFHILYFWPGSNVAPFEEVKVHLGGFGVVRGQGMILFRDFEKQCFEADFFSSVYFMQTFKRKYLIFFYQVVNFAMWFKWFTYDYLDVVGVCEEHGQPINPHAPPTSGREAVLQSNAEILINLLSFIVACISILSKTRPDDTFLL